ncbi:hypothetical protein [Streptomyces atroolivaceus]|uniref:hypothetical protein n=1 Tax=Streptomyces atroolivaceus TaxID=66869 RepID=UPI0020250C5A|nr:hypothetical protein [Streptomyces atroolivaceus]
MLLPALRSGDAVRLGVLDTCFFHGGFPADALLAGRFDLVETSAFGDFAAKGDFLRGLGELLLGGDVLRACAQAGVHRIS